MKIEKKYYSIGEVADMVGLKEHVLRFWEKEFDFLQPIKNNAGHRKYTLNDVGLIKKIQKLVYEEKYTISGAKKKLSENVDDVFDEGQAEDKRNENFDFAAFDFENSEDDIAATISKISEIVDDAVGGTKSAKPEENREIITPNAEYIIPIKRAELINQLFEILKLL